MSVADPTTASAPAALVSTDWAREHLHDPKVRFLEVDVDTDAYDTGHLPGATGINWKSQLTDSVVRDLVSREELQSLLRAAGVDDDTRIVLYGDNNNWFAAWAYWQLRYQGLDNVSLLDGGRIKVEADGLPLTTDAPSHPEGSITLPDRTREELRAYREQVIDGAGSARDLVDVRSPEEFRGELAAPAHLPQEAAQRRGHIPGAVNVPWSTAVAEDGTFKPIEQLRELYGAKGVSGEDEVVAYCRIGERSSHTWFVLHELLGYRNVRNYDGSWTEYGSLVGVPIEVGEASAN
ncbi:MAG: thiosulfate/3-mercaptopyruvate sulfurtransferase [Chloroflexota bacterium]|jgi:thiosulfate/3-mercaptopyruvate sulfurtransferase|nr:thiosulfate/3-mercaptopyruvate sulfurtransferase [Chloroflexota bacterium]